MSVSASTFGTQALTGSAGAGSLNLTSFFVQGLVVYGFGTIYKPLASCKFKNDGQLQKAGGSTAAFLTYTNILNQWHTSAPAVDGSLYEIYFDTATNDPGTGSAATWFGDLENQWISLEFDRTWTLQKDSTFIGSNVWVVPIEVREIATPANTTGPINCTFSVITDN